MLNAQLSADLKNWLDIKIASLLASHPFNRNKINVIFITLCCYDILFRKRKNIYFFGFLSNMKF